MKIVFIGNPLGGDDGVGPYLYKELKDDPRLRNHELDELGVIGFDLINHVNDGDELIIVDALHSESDYGEVVLLGQDDLSEDMSLVSQHDFGVEHTSAIIKHYTENVKLYVIGIKVGNLKISTELSEELKSKIPQIKKRVVELIESIGDS